MDRFYFSLLLDVVNQQQLLKAGYNMHYTEPYNNMIWFKFKKSPLLSASTFSFLHKYIKLVMVMVRVTCNLPCSQWWYPGMVRGDGPWYGGTSIRRYKYSNCFQHQQQCLLYNTVLKEKNGWKNYLQCNGIFYLVNLFSASDYDPDDSWWFRRWRWCKSTMMEARQEHRQE